jgi:hypothetical protein
VSRRIFYSFLGVGAVFSLIQMVVRAPSFSIQTIEKTPRVLVTHRGDIGEMEMAARICNTLNQMNVECAVLPISSIPLIKRVFPSYRETFTKHYAPDFILSLQGGFVDCPSAKQYLAMTHGSYYYLSSNAPVSLQTLANYDALLISSPEKEKVLLQMQLLGFSPQKMDWYSTCPSTAYHPVENFRLLYFGCNFANTPLGDTLAKVFARLDTTNYFDVYGIKSQWRHVPNSYRGYIKNDGVSVIDTIHKTGVILIFHSPDHYLGKTPTAKIFEACAASAVIIADRNPFIREHFGDCILYVDNDKSPDIIFQQIEEHMKWIRSNKEKARELASRAHQIFVTKFSLERQLEELLALYQAQTMPEKQVSDSG